jgi:hypothetical protein
MLLTLKSDASGEKTSTMLKTEKKLQDLSKCSTFATGK